jgi:hypothetical protein
MGLVGVGKSSHSAFFTTKSSSASAVKMINQLNSSPRSVQARIICIGEKLEVVTFMDTSPFIKTFQK